MATVRYAFELVCFIAQWYMIACVVWTIVRSTSQEQDAAWDACQITVRGEN